jgi:hypothetical protein
VDTSVTCCGPHPCRTSTFEGKWSALLAWIQVMCEAHASFGNAVSITNYVAPSGGMFGIAGFSGGLI